MVDGHNRRYIAEQTGTPYPTLGMEFADRDAVVAWIVKNQLGRRNVTSAQRDMLLARLYRQRVQPVGNPALSNGITVIPLGNPAGNDESRRTRKAVAEEAGVSPATVSRALKSELALKTLGCRAPGLRQAALAGVIGPKAVKELAKAPAATLQALEGLQGKALKTAIKQALHPKPPQAMPDALDKLDDALRHVIEAVSTAEESCGTSEWPAVIRINVHRAEQAVAKWSNELKGNHGR